MALSQAQATAAVATLQKMLNLLGVEATVEDAGGGEGEAVLRIRTTEAGRVIGRNGQHIDSLELLLNRISKKQDEYAPFIKIDVEGSQRRGAAPGDVPGEMPAAPAGDRGERHGPSRGPRFERGERGERDDRGERRGPPRGPRGEGDERRGDHGDSSGAVGQMALDTAKEVKRWGAPKTIGPFNAVERRAIHLALKEVTGIVAESGPDLGGNRKAVTVRVADAATKESPAAGEALS